MSQAHNMTDLRAVRHFMFAGRAVFTLVSKRTGTRFTYKCALAKENRNVMFVRVRTSSDHWTFVGTIFDTEKYVHSRKTNVTEDAESIVAIKWFLNQINDQKLPTDKLEFWHEGHCGKCGRALTVPESIASGFGPQCIELMKGEAYGKYQGTNQEAAVAC